MADALILKNISKKYILNKDRPILLKNLFLPQKKEEVWALKNVSLSIKKGETIGIIGENGSGKSTLLKIIAGITTPTKGTAEINGRVGSLIELGAGFHQDLTGRENIYLNGTLLGFTKKELDKKYDEIVEFADIGKFIDQPIRTYSSGMTVRLGFSVAVHLDPDILLIDEVLAVGDILFQQKCFKVIENFQIQKKTVILVSHDLEIISKFSNKAILLRKGKIIRRDKPESVILTYYLKNDKRNNKHHFRNGVKIKKVELLNISPHKSIKYNQVLGIKVSVKYTEDVNSSYIGYIIKDQYGKAIFAINTFAENILIGPKKKHDTLIAEFRQQVPLKQGKYYVQVHVFPRPYLPIYFDIYDDAAYFVIDTDQLAFTPVYIKPKISIKPI